MKHIKKELIAVALKAVTKSYTLHHQKPTLSEHVMKRFQSEKFTALKNINLTIYQGEKIGIIGQNGSGKTTLLKIIAGITTPSSGRVHTKGKVISLIDIESGFHPDLNGEENIFLNGLLIGMSKAEIKEKFDQIVEFADIGKFIDTPIYTYSEGMKLRLGFAIAVHSDPEILILDEGIGAGDLDFQLKLDKKINELFREKRTIILVSHALELLQKTVHRVYVLNKGKITLQGNTKKVIKEYKQTLGF
jgi:lipopolysaccharide transport system ATP-binding protein